MPPELPGKHSEFGSPIDSLDSPDFDQLCETLRQWAPRWRTKEDWPGEALRLCGQEGVYRWFAPREFGGLQWNSVDRTRGYLRLAEADLLVTFVITQFMGAVRRIVGSENRPLNPVMVEKLLSGETFATVGISHLTTSGRHLKTPPMRVGLKNGKYVFDGLAPWVTGGCHADWLVVGGVMDNGDEVLAAVPGSLPGIEAQSGADLIALSASGTDKVHFRNVAVDARFLISGPCPNVMSTGVGGSAGGLQTSTLALGLSRAAVKYLIDESETRDDLGQASLQLKNEIDDLEDRLLRAADGDETCNTNEIRAEANRLVMRCTQAAMTAAKGAGFLSNHPVGSWACQALFFLVWSCPQPIAQAHLCQLAGITE